MTTASRRAPFACALRCPGKPAPDEASGQRLTAPWATLFAQLKKDEPNLSFGEVGKKLGQMWKDADEKTKKVRARCCEKRAAGPSALRGI